MIAVPERKSMVNSVSESVLDVYVELTLWMID